MTIVVTPTIPRIVYTAAAGQTDFAVPFPVDEATTDLTVTVNGFLASFTMLNPQTSDGFYVGAILRLNVPASLGVTVSIQRNTAREQRTLYPESGAFRTALLNRETSRLWMVAQDLGLEVAQYGQRSLLAPVGEVMNTLPSAYGRANGALLFDGVGQPLIGPYADLVIGFIPSAYGNSLMQQANSAAARSALNLGTAATYNVGVVGAALLVAPDTAAARAALLPGTVGNAVFIAETAAQARGYLELGGVGNAGPMGWRNKVINGDFSIWQRGVTLAVTTDLQRIADRWNISFNGTLGTMAASRQEVSPTLLALTDAKHFGFFDRSVAGSGSTFLDLSTQIEGVQTLHGQTVTISAAVWTNVANTPVILKTEQFFGGGGGGSAPAFTTAPTTLLAAGWQRITWTTTLASIVGKTIGLTGDDTLNVIFSLPPNATFQFAVTDVQLEAGGVATPYERRPRGIELAMCQRYFRRSYEPDQAPGAGTFVGSYNTSLVGAASVIPIRFDPPMRRIPNVTLYNPSTGAAGTWRSGATNVAVTVGDIGSSGFHVDTSGGTPAAPIAGHWTADAEV